jgi:hypothetical protein
LWLMDNVINGASSRSGSTADQCAFFSAVAGSCSNRGAGTCSNCPARDCAARCSRQTKHYKAKYRRCYPRFHLLPPLDVFTDRELTTIGVEDSALILMKEALSPLISAC